MNLAQLRALRKAKAAEARAMHSKLATPGAETRDFTPDEQSAFDALVAKVTELDQRIAALESVEDVEEEDEGEPRDDDMDEKKDRTLPVSRQTRGRVGDPIERRGTGLPDLDGKHPYMLLRAIRHLAGMGKLDGIEAEVHQELAKRSAQFGNRAPQGVLVPHCLSTHHRHLPANLEARGRNRGRGMERRDLTTTTGTGSIANILGTDLIELLRNRMKTYEMGARVLSDMTGGTFSLPKQTGASTAYWVTEGNAPTNSNQQIGQVTFTPKTVGAVTDVSRKFMLQTSLDAEAFTRDDLMKQLAIEMDRAALNGSGTSPEPQGIIGNTNVPTIAIGANGGVPTWSMLVALETQVSKANADVDTMGIIASVDARGRLKATLKDTNTFGIYLWQDNEVNGYKAVATNQIPSTFTKGSGTGLTGMVFGNWDSLVYGLWGALDIIEDPYTKSSSGGLRIVALQDLDIQLRYPGSFAKIVDITP